MDLSMSVVSKFGHEDVKLSDNEFSFIFLLGMNLSSILWYVNVRNGNTTWKIQGKNNFYSGKWDFHEWLAWFLGNRWTKLLIIENQDQLLQPYLNGIIYLASLLVHTKFWNNVTSYDQDTWCQINQSERTLLFDITVCYLPRPIISTPFEWFHLFMQSASVYQVSKQFDFRWSRYMVSN